jgi:hypothetical protein
MRVLFLADGVALFEAIEVDPGCVGIAGSLFRQGNNDARANDVRKDSRCLPKNKLCKIWGYCRCAQEFMMTSPDPRWKLSDLLLIITIETIEERRTPRLIVGGNRLMPVLLLFVSATMHSDDFNAYHERLFISTMVSATGSPVVFCAVCLSRPGRITRTGRGIPAGHQWP